VRRVWAIARRELLALYGGPLAWVLAAIFVGLTGYFFYSELTFFVLSEAPTCRGDCGRTSFSTSAS